MNKHVAGSPDHPVIHDGLRYQFPSAREAMVFSDAPQDFLSSTMMKQEEMVQTGMKKADTPKMKHEDMSEMKTKKKDMSKQVSISGQSACAGCEFGIKPLANPDQLGLAIKVSKNRVVIIENAHNLYPEIYADRFDGRTLKVQGRIVKTDGRFEWLQPSSVEVVN